MLTDAFLAGCALHLRSLSLEYVQLPTLPKLLWSARDLVHLGLRDVPSTGYVSPDMIATCISMLTRLQSL
jgi:hypothetical protein